MATDLGTTSSKTIDHGVSTGFSPDRTLGRVRPETAREMTVKLDPVEEAGSYIDKRNNSVLDIQDDLSSSGSLRDPEAEPILRAHYFQLFLDDLEKIIPDSQTLRAAFHVNRLLKTLRAMRRAIPQDPMGRFTLALLNALATGNRWIEYDADQYSALLSLVKRLGKSGEAAPLQVEEAVVELHSLGFQTMPFVKTRTR